MKKIVITGGHFTPGLAVIEELSKQGGWAIYWIGEKRAVTGYSAKTLEAIVLPGSQIPFYSIKTYKLHRKFTFENIFGIWKLCLGFIQSLLLLQRIKPNVVLSFGSYISVPVAFAAWILGIPIVLHEQTTVSGLANRVVSKVARIVAISFDESKKYFPEDKIVLTGNPVRAGIYKTRNLNTKKPKEPTIYVTGGSRGSQIINRNLIDVLPRVLGNCKVIHQTGEPDFEEIQLFKGKLPKKLLANYEVSANFAPSQVEQIYKKASLVISRAGANTVSELAIAGIPSILIPIPWVESNEQMKNAKMLENIGAAIIIEEANLSGEVLYRSIMKLLNNYDDYKKQALKASDMLTASAALSLVSLLEKSSSNE